MRPLMVINGVLLGSSLSIALSLGMVLVVFLIIGSDAPRIESEMRPLTLSMLIFLSMTIISAGSFYTLAVGHRWRKFAQALLWLGFAGTVWYYWP